MGDPHESFLSSNMNCKAVFNPNSEALLFDALIRDICATTCCGFCISVREVSLPVDTIYDGQVGLSSERVDGFACRNVEAFVAGRQDSITVSEVALLLPAARHNDSALFPLHCRVLRAWNLSEQPGSGWAIRGRKNSAPKSWEDLVRSMQVSRVTGWVFPPVPDLISVIKDPRVKHYVRSRYDQIVKLLEDKSWESAVVECGKALEATLKYALESRAPDQTVPQGLAALIRKAVEQKLVAPRFVKMFDSLRTLRNDSAHAIVDPENECNEEEANIAFLLLKIALRNLSNLLNPVSAA
jgi:hypothetical protein